jgi:hypothetical protein
MKVSGNPSCKAAHYSISHSFQQGQIYYIKAYVRKAYSTDAIASIMAFIGSSGYMETIYPTTIADTVMGQGFLYSWPEDATALTDEMKTMYNIDESPWNEITMTWKPAKNYTSAELYFYNYNFTLAWDQQNVNKPGQNTVIGTVEYPSGARDYLIESVYVGTYNTDTFQSDRRVLNPVQWLYGDSRDKMLQDLFDQFSLEGFFDVYGTYIVRKKRDPTVEIPVWTFTPGADSTMLGISRIQDDLQLVNHIIITNEGANTYSNIIVAEVQVTDTNSPYHKSRIGDRVMVFKMSQISTQATAATAAYAKFIELGAIAEEIKLPTLCIPFLDGNDTISVVEPLSGASANYSCQRVTIPLREIRMDIESKRSEVVV